MGSRREFLGQCGAGAGLAVLGAGWRPTRAEATPPDPAKLADLSAFAMERAQAAGASYADIRINRYRSQAVTFRSTARPRDRQGGRGPHRRRTPSRSASASASSPTAPGASRPPSEVTKDAIARAIDRGRRDRQGQRPAPPRAGQAGARRLLIRTSTGRRSNDRPVRRSRSSQKLDLLRSVATEARKDRPGSSRSPRSSPARLEDRFFASTEGSVIEQHVIQIAPEFTATVDRGRPQAQVADLSARLGLQRGMRPSSAPASFYNARSASPRRPSPTSRPRAVEPGVKDLVLLPTHLALTIHESIGHSTELDRALGYEANYAGTSFLTTGQARQVPGRLGHRQLQRRPDPPREPLDLRVRRRRGQDPAVPDHREGDLRRLPDDPRPGPPDRPVRVDGLLLRRQLLVGAVPADAERLAGAERRPRSRSRS